MVEHSSRSLMKTGKPVLVQVDANPRTGMRGKVGGNVIHSAIPLPLPKWYIIQKDKKGQRQHESQRDQSPR